MRRNQNSHEPDEPLMLMALLGRCQASVGDGQASTGGKVGKR